eukprot:s2457_g1.t4
MPAIETPLKYLLLFTGFSACAQFDSGALAAFENYLTKDLQLTTKDVGTINAMEYIVLPLASPLIPWLLRCWQVKHVLLICLVGNMLGVLMLALAPMAHEKSEATLRALMLASRTVSGLCHAGIAVYGSVWVDLYAPKESAASWLGAMQASSLIGLVIGYTVAGYWGDWSPVFYINLIWFTGTLVGVAVMPRSFLGELGRRSSNQRLSFLISTPGGSFMGPGEEGGEAAVPAPQAEAGEEPQRPLRPRASVEEVIEESLLLYILLALCVSSLFFVSGGLQFWATPYMEQLWRETSGTCASDEEAERVHKMVVSLVALTTLTAPTFGVYLGGTVVDSLGGHKKAPRATLIFLVVGAAVANCCGLIACFCPMFWPAVLGFWAFNMAGAALMPGAFGLMLSAVQSRRRALASAMAQLPINLLGMAGGAFIPGWIAGCEPPEKALPCSAGCDYAVGLRTLLFGPGVGIVLLFFSFLLVKNTTESTEPQPESTELSSSIPSRRAKRSCGCGRGGWGDWHAADQLVKRNLLFVPPSGFWADDDWYDLQMERRLPLTRDVLRELIYALPPLKNLRVADLGAGTGRSAAALVAAYPSIQLTLIEPDEGRLKVALQKLPKAMEEQCNCIVAAAAADGKPLPGTAEGYDCIVALQAVRHIVAPPAHYAAKLKLPVVAGMDDIAEGYAKMFAGIYARDQRPSGSNTLILGIIDQLDGKAGTLVVSLDEPRPFKELLARAAIRTGNSTRRLFSEDGEEMLGIDDIKRIYESAKTTPKPRVVTEAILRGWPGNPNLPIRAMESFEASGAAKRRRLTCPPMPADGVKVKEQRSAHEVGLQKPEKGETKMETGDLWMQLRRQTEDTETQIRLLAGCDRRESVRAEEPSVEKKEAADSVKATHETGAEQEMMLSSADSSHAMQGLEVFESVGVPNEEAAPGDEKTKEASVTMPTAEHPLPLAVAQKAPQVRKYQLAKQSGVPNILWCTWSFAWRVNFPKVDSKGKILSWTNRVFAVKKFMATGCTEAEADAAALEAAKVFRAELVEKGILTEPTLKDPNVTSEVPGVFWSKSKKKWVVEVSLKERKRTRGGSFTEKGVAEEKALELWEKHGLQLQVKHVPSLANRNAGLLAATQHFCLPAMARASPAGVPPQGAIPRGYVEPARPKMACPMPCWWSQEKFYGETQGPLGGGAGALLQGGCGMEEKAGEGEAREGCEAKGEASQDKAKESTKKQVQIDLEVVSTDGSDFKWKWGAGHASYKFGDLLIRPLWRSLAGSKQSRRPPVVHPPQPIPLPTTGNLKDCLPDLWIQCFPLVEKYGPLIRLRIFDDVVYVCADPDTVDIVNQIPDKRLPKEVFGCKALANQGVFITDGQRWEFGRHALQAQLTPEAIDSLIPIFAERCVKLEAVINSHPKDIDIFAWVEKVTMDTICNVGFGHDLKCIESAEMPPLLPLFEEVLEISINSSLYGAFDVLGTRKRWFEGQLSKLDGMLDEIIDAVRSGTHSGSSQSLLHALMNAKCPLTQRTFTQTELRDQLLTMLVAGHKTTTLLLTWSLYYTARNPRIEKKLFAELRQVFGDDMNRIPVGDDLRRLKYMDMVVRETLRLCSPVQVAQRGLTQPVQCGKYTLLPGGHSGRGNSWVAIHIMGISHSKKLWGENAEDFIPERFESDKMKHFHPFQYIPFGGGRRLCIGNLFAITQAKTLLCMILRKYYLRSVAEKPVKMDPKDIATPLSAEKGGGVWLQFTSRDYDEPEDFVPPQPTHGALCRSFVQESLERSRPGTSFAGSSFLGRGSFLSGPPPPFLLLWGGEFKTTQSAAQDLAKTAQSRGLKVEMKTMDEVSPKDLVAGNIKIDGQIPVVLIIVATYNGHPPENAATFYKALSELPASEPGKSELQYAVLGVGNSQWVSTFVKVAKMVDKDLARVGAQKLLPFEVADKNDCFEQSVRSWRKALFSMFASSPEQLIVEQETEQETAEVMEERLQLEAVASGKVATSLTEHFLRSGYQNCKISLNKDCFVWWGLAKVIRSCDVLGWVGILKS